MVTEIDAHRSLRCVVNMMFNRDNAIVTKNLLLLIMFVKFLDPEGGSQNAALVVVVVVVVVISFLRVRKSIRNFAHTFMLPLPTDLPSQLFTYFLINE